MDSSKQNVQSVLKKKDSPPKVALMAKPSSRRMQNKDIFRHTHAKYTQLRYSPAKHLYKKNKTTLREYLKHNTCTLNKVLHTRIESKNKTLNTLLNIFINDCISEYNKAESKEN